MIVAFLEKLVNNATKNKFYVEYELYKKTPRLEKDGALLILVTFYIDTVLLSVSVL